MKLPPVALRATISYSTSVGKSTREPQGSRKVKNVGWTHTHTHTHTHGQRICEPITGVWGVASLKLITHFSFTKPNGSSKNSPYCLNFCKLASRAPNVTVSRVFISLRNNIWQKWGVDMSTPVHPMTTPWESCLPAQRTISIQGGPNTGLPRGD